MGYSKESAARAGLSCGGRRGHFFEMDIQFVNPRNARLVWRARSLLDVRFC
jgi:hypothetical protein